MCTVQIENHEPIIIRAAARAERERGRRTLGADLTQALADLTGDLFAQLPSVAAAHTP